LVDGPEMKLYRMLDWLPSRLYGRISYSFYLYHMICLYVVAKAAFVWIPVLWLARHTLAVEAGLLVMSTAVATLLAWLSQVWVERPGIELSKRLCGGLSNAVGGRTRKSKFLSV
jgi:peptidoglycan/LPS O-acetylase OafA/YrhL